MRVEFASVTISFFIHSTEDETLVEQEVSQTFGLHPGEVSFDKVQGHFGNQMLFAKAHLTGTRAAAVSAVILGKLSERAKSQLEAEIERSTDEHDALYLRLDRQSLSDGLGISDEEPLRVKLKPKVRAGGRGAMIEAYKEMLK
jgi:RNA binding exosome subunit